MWELYDELIRGIPAELTVLDAAAGFFWIGIRSEIGVGISGSARGFTRPFADNKNIIGQPLRLAAERVKSWNLVEASLGLAAINSYYNVPSVAARNGVPLLSATQKDDRMNDPYIFYQNMAKEKRVASVGSSNMLRTLLGRNCDLTVFNDDELGYKKEIGGFPLTACEYLLPDKDFVFLPCISAATKQLPRLLTLCGDAFVIICGPSIPLSPTLFNHGVNDLSGFVVYDSEGDRAMRIVRAVDNSSMFSTGEKVRFKPSDMP